MPRRFGGVRNIGEEVTTLRNLATKIDEVPSNQTENAIQNYLNELLSAYWVPLDPGFRMTHLSYVNTIAREYPQFEEKVAQVRQHFASVQEQQAMAIPNNEVATVVASNINTNTNTNVNMNANRNYSGVVRRLAFNNANSNANRNRNNVGIARRLNFNTNEAVSAETAVTAAAPAEEAAVSVANMSVGDASVGGKRRKVHKRKTQRRKIHRRKQHKTKSRRHRRY